jgi:hypothetical protein
MNLAIVGSRNFKKKWLMDGIIELWIKLYGIPKSIVSGGCSGADKMAESCAKKNSISTIIFHALWNKYGNAAGPIRNKQIVDKSDFMIAFLEEGSKGTKNSINLAKVKKIPLWIIENEKLRFR